MAKNKFKKVKKMYESIWETIHKYQYGPRTMTEIAVEEQDLVYRRYEIKKSKCCGTSMIRISNMNKVVCGNCWKDTGEKEVFIKIKYK